VADRFPGFSEEQVEDFTTALNQFDNNEFSDLEIVEDVTA